MRTAGHPEAALANETNGATDPDESDPKDGDADPAVEDDGGYTNLVLPVEGAWVWAAPDAIGSFIGCFDSGDPDWASTDTKVLRAQADARRPA